MGHVKSLSPFEFFYSLSPFESLSLEDLSLLEPLSPSKSLIPCESC